jgi:WD40 repeat protein
MAFSPTGDQLLLAAEGGITLLTLDDRGRRVLRGHSSYVYSVAWSADGAMLASSGWDGSVRFWDALTGRQIAQVAAQPATPLAPIVGLAFSIDSLHLMVLTHDGALLEIPIASVMAAGASGDTAISASPPIVRDPEAAARFWRLSRPGAKRANPTGGECESKSPDGSLFARVDHGAVVVTDGAGGRERRGMNIDGVLVTATAFSPPAADGIHLAAAGADKVIRIWDTRSQRQIAEFSGHRGPIFTLTFSPDGSRLFSGDGEGLIFIWDTARWEKVAELQGHASYVHSLAVSPDGGTLCSGSGDGTLRLWITGRGDGMAEDRSR